MATAVAALVSSLAALGALYFTDLQSRATQAQIAQAEQGQITSRYTAAVEQLGSGALEVRLGGIYALERLARDSPRDQPTVIEVLSAYLRARLPRAGDPACPPGSNITERQPPPLAGDVLAALTVLSRHDRTHDQQTHVDLSDTCLSAVPSRDLGRLDFTGAVLRNVALAGAFTEVGGIARFAGTDLGGADLTRAALTLPDADFSGANLIGVIATDAQLGGDFKGTVLDRAHLEGAELDGFFDGASLNGTYLVGSNLDGVRLRGAHLTGADLTRAVLTAAQLQGSCFWAAKLVGANLSGADLAGAVLAPRGTVTSADFDRLNEGCSGSVEPADVSGADLRGAHGVDLTGTVGRPAFGPVG